MLWVLNVGGGVEGGLAGLVGVLGWFRGIRHSRFAAARICRVEPFPRGLRRWFSTARHTYRAHAEARMIFARWTASLGAIKDIDLVRLFLLDLVNG